MLNEIYTEFDRISAAHKVYKVETIGDSYMVVSGAPDRVNGIEAACRCARFGLDIIDFIDRFQTSNGQTVQVRCAILIVYTCRSVHAHQLPERDRPSQSCLE